MKDKSTEKTMVYIVAQHIYPPITRAHVEQKENFHGALASLHLKCAFTFCDFLSSIY